MQLDKARRFMRLKEVKHQVGLGRSAIYSKVKTGEFPAPVKLSEGGRAVGWDSYSIESYIASRIEAAGVSQ